MAELRCRPAVATDAAAASRIVIDGWCETYAGFLPAGLLAGLEASRYHDVQSWAGRIAEGGCWMLERAGAMQGILRISFAESCVPGTEAELTTLYVAAGARGQGLGGQAIGFARAQAAARGTAGLGVCVLAGNQRGEAFYRRHGARFVAEAIAFDWNGVPVRERQFRLA